mmetsp:Transcript_4593/g.5030  ORF Transcript_4593/g.5030 Transcript_4593/m.5030 type:complete len:107 (-) Transcript_4593:691-1011(-)|eukprot:gene4861-5215_t
MCRHIINAKVFVQASCCNGWFDCAECHDEIKDHPFVAGKILRLLCKSCSRIFQRDLGMFLESDKYCEQCKDKWCVPGETPESLIYYESRDYVNGVLENILLDAEKR